jgi:hypothetical protein
MGTNPPRRALGVSDEESDLGPFDRSAKQIHVKAD